MARFEFLLRPNTQETDQTLRERQNGIDGKQEKQKEGIERLNQLKENAVRRLERSLHWRVRPTATLIDSDEELTQDARRKRWDQVAPIYDRVKAVIEGQPTADKIQLIEWPYLKTLIEVLQVLKEDAVVLDFGAGAGLASQLFKKEGFFDSIKKFINLDFSAGMLSFAQRRQEMMPSKVRNKITHVQADGVQIPLPDNSVDFCIALNSIDNISDKLAAVNEVVRVLKPGHFAFFLFRDPERNRIYGSGSTKIPVEKGSYAENWFGTNGHQIIADYDEDIITIFEELKGADLRINSPLNLKPVRKIELLKQVFESNMSYGLRRELLSAILSSRRRKGGRLAVILKDPVAANHVSGAKNNVNTDTVAPISKVS